MRITFTLIVLLYCFNASAQTSGDRRYNASRSARERMPETSDFNTWDIGGSLGLTYPRTDISGAEGKFGFSLDATKFISHSLALQAKLIHATLGGEDMNRPEYRFNTTINYDFTLNAMFQFGNISFLKRMPDFALYMSAGAGVIHYSPDITLDGGISKLHGIYSQYAQTFDTFDFKGRTDFMLPVSVGAKYRVSDHLSICAEYSYRMTNTDKLDGFFKLLSSNDSYSFFSAGIVYHLGPNSKVIEWENPVEALYADLDMMRGRLERSLRDSDSDGVPDLYDKEAATPAGTKVYGDGTSVDTDGDGVSDRLDAEPFSAKNAKVDASGKEIVKAAVPPPPPPVAQPVATPVVIDSTPAIVNGNQLPSIYFGFDSSRINKIYNETLGKIAEKMRSNPSVNYRIIGITDGGGKWYNVNLSQKRADLVKRHLIKYYNINPARLTTEVKSVPGEEGTSRAINRRVDVIVK